MAQSSRYKTETWQPRNLVGFFLIAFGWTWFWWALFIFDYLKMPAGLGTQDIDLGSAGPVLLVVILSPFGPTIAGFVLTARNEGKAGVVRLWKRFWNRNLSWKWLLVILFFFPVKNLILRFSGQIFAGISQAPFEWLNQPWLLLPPFIASILHGGLSEEFGWRGYALPRFQARWNALAAALLLGFIEGCWHIPLVFMPGDERFGMLIPVLILPYFATGIFRTWIFNNTAGSVLAAVLFHAAGNTAGWAVPVNVPSQSFADLIYTGLAVALVLIFGPKNLMREKAVFQTNPETVIDYPKRRINMAKNGYQSSRKISYTALALALGLVLGGIVGLLIDNLVIFSGGGLVLGLAIGAALDSRRKDSTT